MSFFKETLKLRLFALAKIPLIYFVRPKILNLSDDEIRVCIPLKRRNRNHVGSMYFGALSVGADLCVGLMAMRHIEKSGKKLVLIFKDFQADFKKLAKGDVHFVCKDGDKVRDLVAAAAQTGERQSAPIRGVAIVPSQHPSEAVMEFTLTLSLKAK